VTAVIGGRDGLDSTEIAMCDLLSQIPLVSVEASEVSLFGARSAGSEEEVLRIGKSK